MKIRVDFDDLAFRLFVAWVFISAFYYVGSFIDGQVLVERSEGFIHKAFKYVAAMSLSAIFFLFHRQTKLLLQYLAISFAFFGMSLYWILGYNVVFAIDLLTVLVSFIGLTYAASSFSAKQVSALTMAIVIAASIVSSISYFEYYFMEPVLGEYWRNTGGFRSISTLLNPNNLGLFLGGAFILLAFGNQFSASVKLLMSAVICGAFLMTGSRTAWLSLAVALSLGFLYRGAGRIHTLNFFKFSTLIPLILTAFSVLYFTGMFSLPERAVDMYTAVIRIEKYFQYLLGVDFTYLFPDLELSRIDIVSESAYFHFTNALGILWAGVVAISLMAFFCPAWLKHLFSNSPFRCFDIVVFYYVVAMLFENVLMSFPNNQLLFISVGVSMLNARNDFLSRQNASQTGVLRESKVN